MIKSFERSSVEKSSIENTPLDVRVSRGTSEDLPDCFQVFPVRYIDGTNRERIRWVIPSSLGDIDVTEEIVA